MDTILDHNKKREDNITKGFYLDTPENRKKYRVGQGYDSDAGVTLSAKELTEKFGAPVPKSTTKTNSVKTGDVVVFERDGKRFGGKITRYPSNDKIEINYGAVIIHKDEIKGSNGKLFEGVEHKEASELAPMGQEAGTSEEKALRSAEKLKLEGEIKEYKDLLKLRALHGVVTPKVAEPGAKFTEHDAYKAKLKRYKQLGGDSKTSLYGFVAKEDTDQYAPVEDLEAADRIRRSIDAAKPRTLVSIVDKVKDTLAEHFDVDTVTAYRNDFMKSPLYKESLKGGFDEAKLVAAFDAYSSSFFSPRGITSMF